MAWPVAPFPPLPFVLDKEAVRNYISANGVPPAAGEPEMADEPAQTSGAAVVVAATDANLPSATFAYDSANDRYNAAINANWKAGLAGCVANGIRLSSEPELIRRSGERLIDSAYRDFPHAVVDTIRTYLGGDTVRVARNGQLPTLWGAPKFDRPEVPQGKFKAATAAYPAGQLPDQISVSYRLFVKAKVESGATPADYIPSTTKVDGNITATNVLIDAVEGMHDSQTLVTSAKQWYIPVPNGALPSQYKWRAGRSAAGAGASATPADVIPALKGFTIEKLVTNEWRVFLDYGPAYTDGNRELPLPIPARDPYIEWEITISAKPFTAAWLLWQANNLPALQQVVDKNHSDLFTRLADGYTAQIPAPVDPAPLPSIHLSKGNAGTLKTYNSDSVRLRREDKDRVNLLMKASDAALPTRLDELGLGSFVSQFGIAGADPSIATISRGNVPTPEFFPQWDRHNIWAFKADNLLGLMSVEPRFHAKQAEIDTFKLLERANHTGALQAQKWLQAIADYNDRLPPINPLVANPQQFVNVGDAIYLDLEGKYADDMFRQITYAGGYAPWGKISAMTASTLTHEGAGFHKIKLGRAVWIEEISPLYRSIPGLATGLGDVDSTFRLFYAMRVFKLRDTRPVSVDSSLADAPYRAVPLNSIASGGGRGLYTARTSFYKVTNPGRYDSDGVRQSQAPSGERPLADFSQYTPEAELAVEVEVVQADTRASLTPSPTQRGRAATLAIVDDASGEGAQPQEGAPVEFSAAGTEFAVAQSNGDLRIRVFIDSVSDDIPVAPNYTLTAFGREWRVLSARLLTARRIEAVLAEVGNSLFKIDAGAATIGATSNAGRA